jgi:hypothetical protein
MTMKEAAISAMKSLGIYAPYIQKFEKDGTVTLFERFGGYYITEDQEPELFKKIKEFQDEYQLLVYAVTHEIFEFGECYSFLVVSKYEEEWNSILENIKYGYVFAYVWNKDNEWCSEFGDITLRSFGGGIARVG